MRLSGRRPYWSAQGPWWGPLHKEKEEKKRERDRGREGRRRAGWQAKRTEIPLTRSDGEDTGKGKPWTLLVGM